MPVCNTVAINGFNCMLNKIKAGVVPGSFYKMWIMTSGIYMTAGRCPCCGGQGCPVGLGAAVLIGGSIAGIVHGAGALRKKLAQSKSVLVEKGYP